MSVRRWIWRGAAALALVALLLLGLFTAVGGWRLIEKPSLPFDARRVPPAPDYSRPTAWLAFPGHDGLERSTPPGLTAIDEASAPADVFFIHPTTFKGSPVWVAPYDATDMTPLNPPVLLDQVSVFNGCCRVYAPHYRQATLAGLKVPAAMDIAYADVARAFRYFIAHHNDGRPFIIASHSQGTAHAIRLLQTQILGTPLQQRLVAAYLIGGYVPDSFGKLGLPVCDAPQQTGCVLSYNSSEAGRTGARMITDNKTYWWRGALTSHGRSKAVCVNPLNWRNEGAAPAHDNPGSLPFPKRPFGQRAAMLPALLPRLTGAVCHDQLLDVTIPWSAPSGFTDALSWMFGSYHLNDYGIFYASLRRNAMTRVAAMPSVRERH